MLQLGYEVIGTTRDNPNPPSLWLVAVVVCGTVSAHMQLGVNTSIELPVANTPAAVAAGPVSIVTATTVATVI